MALIPNAFAQFLLSKQSKYFARLKTQTLQLAQQYIVDGIGFTSNWLETNMSVSTSYYATFDVPSGYKMALDYRLVNTSADMVTYRVYPQGTYTAGTVKTDNATNFAKTRNSRQDSGFVANPFKRINISVAPAKTDAIIILPVFGVAGSGSGGNKASGDLSSDNSYLLLNGNQQFLLEFENGGAATASAQLVLNYAFIPDALVSPSEV